MNDNYEDIINLPHYDPQNHPRMDRSKRIAQFAPFAALTGYEEQVKEAGRLTMEKIEISEELRNTINNKLQTIMMKIKSKPKVTITYFVQDKRKRGGTYITITGNVKKIDQIEKQIIMTDNKKISMNNVLKIEETN